jgi:YVTN family beta-propeller protein
MSMKIALAAVGAMAVIASPSVASAAASDAGIHLLQSISLPGTEGWDYLSVDSAARRLYVSRGTHVAVIDIDAGKVVGDIPDTAGVHGVAIDTADGKGFTSNGKANSVTVFDLKTLAKTATVAVGNRPDAILYDPSTARVFTFNAGGPSATAIDAKTDTVVGTVPLPGKPEFAAADGKGMIYDNIEDKSEIVAIDAKALTVTATWPIAPCESPSGLAFDIKHQRLFSVCDGGKMAVTDAKSGKVVATPVIGNGPDAAGFDPKTGNVYSTNGEDGTLTVLHEQSPDVYTTVGTATTKPGARTMALDEKTHRIYTIAGDLAPAPTVAPGEPAPKKRRSYVDGSVTVLVYGEK